MLYLELDPKTNKIITAYASASDYTEYAAKTSKKATVSQNDYDLQIALKIKDGTAAFIDEFSFTNKKIKYVGVDPAVVLSNYKNDKIILLQSEFDLLSTSPITVNKADFQVSKGIFSKIESILLALNNGWVPPKGQDSWLDVNNKKHPLTTTFLTTLHTAILDRYNSLFFRLRTAKDAVNKAKTTAAVDKVSL